MPVKVFVVWEPMLATDWMRPGASVLARLPDTRAVQYWDGSHLLARKLSGDARDPQPKPVCCRRDGILWDLAAVYTPGVQWKDTIPAAVFFDGPIVKIKDGLSAALDGITETRSGSAPVLPERPDLLIRVHAGKNLFDGPSHLADSTQPRTGVLPFVAMQ
jgi:hypothetical protein